MQIIPVLDLKGGQAVHAVAGQRDRYGPLQSRFAPGPDPVALARGLRDQLGASSIYLADLDAIVHRAEPAWATLEAIADLGLNVWADIGIRDGAEVDRLRLARVPTIVVGLESCRGPEVLARIVKAVGPDRVVWSLDLRGGQPILAEAQTWRGDPADPANLIEQAVAAGVRQILRLDLATVGTGQGVASIPPAPKVWPGVSWSTGGGVAQAADLDVLAGRGYSAVLVGSALHDGRIEGGSFQRPSDQLTI